MNILFLPKLKKTKTKNNYAIVVIETGQNLHQFVLIVSKSTGYSGIERIKGVVVIGRED